VTLVRLKKNPALMMILRLCGFYLWCANALLWSADRRRSGRGIHHDNPFAVTNHTNGDMIEWFTGESIMPWKNGDVPERIFAICNSHSHWFLTILQPENQCYYDYESSKGIVPEKVKLE
jgi:hypothetical protein